MALEDARRYADNAIEKATEAGLAISVAVLDEFGVLVQLDRMESASPMTADIAEAKAVTAFNFRRPTSEVARALLAAPEKLISLRTAVHFAILLEEGGVPLITNGVIAGAVGVSSGTEDEDEMLAREIARLAENR